MKFKEYPKTYENVFTSERTQKRCDIDKVSVDFRKGSNRDIDVFQVDFRSEIKKLQIETFNHLVKIEWMYRRFMYDGMRRKRYGNGHYIDRAFGIFMRNYVGFDSKLISDNKLYNIVIGYIDNFFSDFNIGNPFTEEFKYPYEYINFEHLVLVYKMSERMELLKVGEKRNMNYTVFLDYVINYIMSYNEEHGEKYTLVDNEPSRYIALINRNK